MPVNRLVEREQEVLERSSRAGRGVKPRLKCKEIKGVPIHLFKPRLSHKSIMTIWDTLQFNRLPGLIRAYDLDSLNPTAQRYRFRGAQPHQRRPRHSSIPSPEIRFTNFSNNDKVKLWTAMPIIDKTGITVVTSAMVRRMQESSIQR